MKTSKETLTPSEEPVRGVKKLLKKVPSMENFVHKVGARLPRPASWASLDEAAYPRRRSFSADKSHHSPCAFDPKLHVAVAEGNLHDVSEILSNQRVDVNQVDYEKRTPLHVAAKYKNMDMIKVLLAKGADVNAVDAHNRTPLFEAGDSQEIIDFLKRHGAVDSLKYFARQAQKESEKAQGTMESTDVINSSFLRKVIITFLTPLVILLVMNGYWFAIKFLLLSLGYYFVLVSYFVSEITIRPPWYRPNANKLTMQQLPEYWQGIVTDPRYDLGLEYEDVVITTHDNWKLSGWYVPAAANSTSKTTGVVLVHGGGRDRRAFLRHVKMLNEEGFEVILFDFREHGMSEGTGKGFAYGMRERYDVAAAARYLRARCNLKTLVVMGTSVGGSASIMAAAIEPTIDVVIAENPITTVGYLQHQHIYNILGGYFKHSVVSLVLFEVFRWLARKWINIRVGNFPGKKCQAAHVISTLAPRPVLLMHGTADEVVPVEHSEILFSKANEPKELWLAPDAFHCGLYDMFPSEFRKRVITFIRTHEKV
eukprot:PhF_6_TR2220/c0_g1_i1/m.3707